MLNHPKDRAPCFIPLLQQHGQGRAVVVSQEQTAKRCEEVGFMPIFMVLYPW